MKTMIERLIVLDRLQRKIADGQAIIGAGAGTGLSAKCEEIGGIDLIVIYNSGRYRMAGRGSLAGLMPYGDANAIVMDMAREVLTVVDKVPVLAGVCATDPFRSMDIFLDEVKAAGFAGVQNFPTVGLIDGVFRQNLEETGMSYALEVEMIALAKEKELLTTPYVFSAADAAAMADAGADIIVCHLGLTAGGAIGAETSIALESCPAIVDEWAVAALERKSDAIVLVHGGPVSSPRDAAFMMAECRYCDGFYGASSMERLPTEIALVQKTKEFMMIGRKGREGGSG